MIYVAIVLIIASFIIQALSTKKAAQPKPAAITDFQFPQSAEGQPQAVIFGDAWINDYQVLWFGNFRTSKIKQKSGGKKG